jgi:hypothetical protein
MTDDTTPGDLETHCFGTDERDRKLLDVKATRETEAGSVRIEHRTVRTNQLGSEVAVVLHGWDEGGPRLEVTGGKLL